MSRWPAPNARIAESFDPKLDYSPRLRYRVKDLIYAIGLPAYSALRARQLGLNLPLPSDVLIGGRGSEFDLLLFQQGRKNRIIDEAILLQGVGDGRELVMWQHYGPAKIVGADLEIHLDENRPQYPFG